MLALPALVMICAAQMYEWTDASGVQHFSDQAPQGVKARITEGDAITEMGAPAPSATTATAPATVPATTVASLPQPPPPAAGTTSVAVAKTRDDKTFWHDR